MLDLQIVETAGEGDYGAFAGGVVEEVGAADVGVYGGVIYDCGAGFHVWEGVFGEVEVGVDVGVEGREPLLSVDEGMVVSNGGNSEVWQKSREGREGEKTYSESSAMLLVIL